MTGTIAGMDSQTPGGLRATAARELLGARQTRMRGGGQLELRAAGEGEPLQLVGYATLWDTPYEVWDWFGEYTEQFAPGAFTASLARGADVRLLINHEGLPLARASSGNLTLTEDDTGLRVEAQLDAADPDVQRIAPKMARHDLREMSHMFSATR